MLRIYLYLIQMSLNFNIAKFNHKRTKDRLNLIELIDIKLE